MPQDSPELQETLERPVSLVQMVSQEIQGPQDSRDLTDQQDQSDHRVLRDHQDRMVSPVRQETQGLRVLLVPWEPQDPEELMGHQGSPEPQGLRVLRDQQVTRDRRVSLVLLVR